MRTCPKQPQVRFQRSLAAPSNVMTQPTRAKMQGQEEEDKKIYTESAEEAGEKRITEEG